MDQAMHRQMHHKKRTGFQDEHCNDILDERLLGAYGIDVVLVDFIDVEAPNLSSTCNSL